MQTLEITSEKNILNMSHIEEFYQMTKQIRMVYTDTLGKALTTHSAEKGALIRFAKIYE